MKSYSNTYRGLKSLMLGSLLAVSMSAPVSAAEVTFTEIPVAVHSGGWQPMAVSENGVVALRSSSSFYKWSKTTGLTNLGLASGGTVASISNDGNVVSFTPGFVETSDAYVFTGTTKKVVAYSSLWSSALSADGKKLGGRKNNFPSTLTLANNTFSTNTNPTLTGGSIRDYSTSGLVQLVAKPISEYWNQYYFVSSAGGIQPLGYSFFDIQDLSGDGNTVIGHYGTTCVGACTWSAAKGLIAVGEFKAEATNYDGSIVVGSGYSNDPGGKIWDAINGVRDISDVLAAKGIDISAWTGVELSDISDDGYSIVGFGTNPQGVVRGFLISVVPQCSGL